MEIIYVKTSDDLRLQGIHYSSTNNNICLILVHGMSGNFIENAYANVIGQTLSSRGISVIYGHNRGHSHINDIATSKFNAKDGYETKRIGAVYERFTESEFDIQAWVDEARKLGYKKIILAGHSLGGPKVVNYLSKHTHEDIAGLILLSPADMVGLLIDTDYYTKLLAEARKNVKEGNPRKILNDPKVWDFYNLSSQTFLDLFEEGGPADKLPIKKNPDVLPELASIKIPILAIIGQYDDVIIRGAKEDMELLKSKATNAKLFDYFVLPGAEHNYQQKETELAKVLEEWIAKTL